MSSITLYKNELLWDFWNSILYPMIRWSKVNGNSIELTDCISQCDLLIPIFIETG